MTKGIARIQALTAPGGAADARTLAGGTHVLVRVAVGALFLQHGLQKLFGLLGGFMGTPGTTAPLFSQMGVAGVLELAGGILLVAGLLTRPVALVLMLEMIAAYFIAHVPQGGFPIQSGGELALLFAATFAFFTGNGAGPLSLDGVLARRSALRLHTGQPALGSGDESERRSRERRTRAA